MGIQPLVALDIGSTKVACAIGLPVSLGQDKMVVAHAGVSSDHSVGFQFLGSSLIPYPTRSEGWLSDHLVVSRTIEQALEAAAVNADLSRALVTIHHPDLMSEQVQVSIVLGDEPMTVRAQDVERLRQGALHQVLGIDREALLVERLDCSGNGFKGVHDPVGLAATRLTGRFHIITMPMAVRRAVVQVVEAAGLEVAQLTYRVPAALASLEEEELSQKRTLLIDVGGLSTDLGLFVGGVLSASAIIQWGGLKLAMTIAASLQVTMDQGLIWSLEGTACRKAEVRALVEREWGFIQQATDRLIKDQPRPDVVVISGRGALIDGFAEYIERATGISTRLCRSPRASNLGDLSRQVGLSPAIGLLVSATRASNGVTPRSPRLFNRLVERTRAILTEYF